MFLEKYRDAPPFSGKRWFVVTPASDPDTVLERFEAPDWGPAILLYAERLQRGAYPVPAALRVERPGEEDGQADGEPPPVDGTEAV
jgi:hypothetical protein